MSTDTQDRVLREAGAHLARALAALQVIGSPKLEADALDLANRVLLARRQLRSEGR